jgi:membrane associated rhomboid family serine protease
MITIAIIAVTAITSLYAFNNMNVMHKLIFNPYTISAQKQWYRFFSSGLIHADMFHLFFNMYALYLFGGVVEHFFLFKYGEILGIFLYIFLYVSAIGVSGFPDYQKHRHNARYHALGASGAVAAIIFASIIIYPSREIMIFPIRFFMPSYVFGVLYIAYSYYMSNKNMDNIGHNAHLFGALYGLLFIFVVYRDALQNFLGQVMGY